MCFTCKLHVTRMRKLLWPHGNYPLGEVFKKWKAGANNYV